MFGWRFLIRVLYKSLLIFIFLNIFLIFTNPVPLLGRISGYNLIFPGRTRFPFGENSAKAYNISLNDLEAMFASHEIKNINTDHFNVFILGDSSVWGSLLRPEETLTGQLNKMNLKTPLGAETRFFNLGYPSMSLLKDLIILKRALNYQPDMIIWMVTLESFVDRNQFSTPFVDQNLKYIDQKFLEESEDKIDKFTTTYLVDYSIFGHRRNIADLVRLQLFGVMWAATGIDQDYPENYTPALKDLESNEAYYDFNPKILNNERLAFDVLKEGIIIAGDVPLIVINEPIMISKGANSDIRYNFYYPKWVYDQYRIELKRLSEMESFNYLDSWNTIDATEFTNTAIHLTPEGTRFLAAQMADKVGQWVGE